MVLVAHRLVVDDASWRLIVQDLYDTYRRLPEQAPVRIGTTPFTAWVERMMQYAASSAFEADAAIWAGDEWRDAMVLPVDRRDTCDTGAARSTVSISLGEVETRALLELVPAAYGTQTREVLLTALSTTLSRWTDADAVAIELEDDTREVTSEGIDTTRTVGWMTSYYPTLLASGQDQDPGARLKAVKEQIRGVPQRGIGYGVLRSMRASSSSTALPRPELAFRYLEPWQVVTPGWDVFPPGPDRITWVQESECLLHIEGAVVDNCLIMSWRYRPSRHDRVTIETLAEETMAALRVLIAHCTSPEAGGYTPSDFTEANLSQSELDALLAELG
jgi:non-ribosomal peptide synthase protein (TIGR01720 family)